MTNQTPGQPARRQAERPRRELRVRHSQRKGSRASGRAAASLEVARRLGGTVEEGPTLSAEWGYISRVLLDRSRRADHARRLRKSRLLVSSLACAALAIVVLAAAACGTTTSPTPTPADSSTPTAKPTPTVDPTDAALIHDYDQAWAAWGASVADPTNGNDYPGLDEWYTGYELNYDVSWLNLIAKVGGQVVVGTVTPHPVVTSVDGSTATVQDCAWDTQYVAYKGTTTPTSPQPYGWTTASGWENLTVTMLLQSGTWKISNEVSEATPCTPASASP